jgi:pilus assembly protein CpaC
MRRSLYHSLTAFAVVVAVSHAFLDARPGQAAEVEHRSYLRIGAGAKAQPVALGLNKSMIIELPREVRDVMVSNPEKIDAVMQSSTRAYLIGKDTGEANVIFLDKDSNQVATLEVSVARDLSQLDDLLARLIPGSKIHIDAIGERTVLTGTVPNPIDASRACEIVTAFLGPLDQLNSSSGSSNSGQSSASNSQGGGLNSGQNNGQSSGSGGGCAGSGDSNSGNSAPQSVINMITVEAREQVLLKVSVVEMERNIVKQFGVDLGALVNSGNFAFAALSKLPFPINPQGGGFIAPFIPNPAGALPDATGFPSNVSPGVAGGGVQWMNGPDRVQTVLRALEEDGLLHTLAEPNLTAISGETANFLAGGEFPIPIAQQLGTISVEFKKFGIGLAFTPVVMSEGRISLKVSTEVSELSNEGAVVLSNITIPALKVRRAETVVELPSGGSLVMAGLLSDQSKQALSGYPGLKSLPVLGTLFRSRDYLKNETELVVLVTPYVVKPVPRSNLAQPDDGFGWASDVNSDLLGQMNRVYGRNPERAPVGRFNGDLGFVVE